MKTIQAQVSHEDLMRFLDGELSTEERERVDRHLTGCRSLQKEVGAFRRLGSDVRALLLSFAIPHHQIWELIREELPGQDGTIQ